MNADFAAAMRRATLLTRAQDVAGATRLIQIALAGQPASESHGTGPQAVIPPRSPQPSPGRLVDADIAALTMAGRVGGEVRPRQRIEHLRELIVRPSDYRLRIRLKYSRP